MFWIAVAIDKSESQCRSLMVDVAWSPSEAGSSMFWALCTGVIDVCKAVPDPRKLPAKMWRAADAMLEIKPELQKQLQTATVKLDPQRVEYIWAAKSHCFDENSFWGVV